ncbi:unnamed protein product [Ixodes persulcatus]
MQLLLHDLCWHVLEDRLKVEQAVSALAEVTALHQELPSMLADVIFLLDMETLSVENRDQRDRFYWLVGGCAKVVPDSLLKERLDIETLGDGGIVKNSRVMLTKFVKIKTRLFYKQNKYNLFREESEGYAKLTTELSQEITSKISPDYMIEVMRSLIGCFNLDPNRVLDVVLEAFECRLHLEDFFVPLLTKFLRNPATISQVLGFKFTFYQGEAGEPTPASLYRLAALLIRNELIALDDLYSLLLPDDGALSRQHKKEVAAAKTYARRATVVVVSSDKKDEEKKEEDKDDDLTLEENQKLGLCEALLEVGDWPNAQKLMARLPEHYAVSQPHIARRLCLLVHTLVEPLYRRHSGLPEGFRRSYASSRRGGLRPPVLVETFGDFQARALPMLVALGPMLHLDPVLIVKVVRLARAHLHKTSSSAAGDLRFDLLTLVGESLLPSLSLLDCNCCVADEIWSLLKLYPYQQRYRLYSQWKNEAYVSHPLLIRVKADSLKRIKYIMKRLSKENVKPSGRQIGKLSHSNPCFLFDYILSQIQTWDNLIVPVVDSLKYLTMLSYDVLAYCVAEALCNPEKDRMKHDGTSISLWLQSLASFCGAVFKKYSIDLTGLLQLVANQLKAEKSLDLLVLKDIVQKMTGIESTEQATQDQLEAMCGGELLKAEGGYFHQLRNTKKSSQRLKEALLEQDLALPLCLLMAQQKNCILYRDQEASHLKLVGKLYDQCQDTLVQFGSFLSSSLSTEEYAGRLPPVDQLLSRFHVQADVAFFLARPMFGHSIALKFDDAKRRDKTFKSLTAAQKLQRYVDAVDQVMSRVVESVRPLHPSKTWEDLSPQFYVTFWSLSMYDLHVPTSSYEREVGKLKQQVVQAEDSKDMVSRATRSAILDGGVGGDVQTRCLGRVSDRRRARRRSENLARRIKRVTQCRLAKVLMQQLDVYGEVPFTRLFYKVTARCRSSCCFTKSLRLASTSANTPFFGLLKLLIPLHANRACFCRLHPRMLPSFKANCRPAALLPMRFESRSACAACFKMAFFCFLVRCAAARSARRVFGDLTMIVDLVACLFNRCAALFRSLSLSTVYLRERAGAVFACKTDNVGSLHGTVNAFALKHLSKVQVHTQNATHLDCPWDTPKRWAILFFFCFEDGAKEKRGDSVRESNSSPALSGNSSGKLSSSGGGLVQSSSSSSSSSSKMTSSSSSSATRRESSSFGAVVESATTAAFPRRSVSKESGSGDGHDKGATADRKGSSLSSLHEQDVRPSKDDVHKNDHWLEPGDAPGDHKRRRVDGGSSSGGSSSGKVGGSPRGRSLGGTQSPKVPEPEGKSEDRGGMGDRPSEKWAHPKDSHDPATGDKGKAKKGSRKRDHSDEPPLEGKRKKDEDACECGGDHGLSG